MLLVIECPDRKINVTKFGLSDENGKLEYDDLNDDEKERLWMCAVIITDGKVAK